MTELDDFTRSYGYLLGYVQEATRETYRRFDALFERGLPPGADVDWPEYGRWAQLKLSLGQEGGHDHDERVLRLIRSVAERDIPWTPGDARVLMYVAQDMVRWGHTRYEEIFRLPLAVTRRFGFQERREILGWLGEPDRRSRSRMPAWEARTEQVRQALAGQLEELLIEPAEHGPDGVREEQVGDYLVRLCADGSALRFVNPSGRTVKSAPQAIRKDPALADLRITLKELKQALSAERFRLEQALVKEREWRWQEVTEFFLDHPVTGLYARTLIWQLPQGPAGLPARTDSGWELIGPRGHRVQPDPDTPVTLWHPIHATAEDVRAWRDHLLEHGIRQPYKQVFREVYLLTPAEEQTRTYSNRFAGHVLRYGQAKTLLNQRGWTGLAIGHWDYECGGDQGEAVKELSGWRARWGMHVVSDPAADGWETASLCATEQITFYRDGQEEISGNDWAGNRTALEGASLTEVPPLVLSEMLRDADLAVGVTSVGLDQQAAGGHEDYWHSYGFGELTETAQTRRDALTRLLPRLRIADRAELTDRFLRVRGDRRTYRIHLGSGNILMEPNDAYLCIVPGNDRATASVFLPFEEDGGMLSVILSKAFLLADDTAITDPSITRQLDA